MRKFLFGLFATTIVFTPATAALRPGAIAPDFVTTGAIGGNEFRFHLAQQLRKGPVVLYFFPKAFTSGCTQEAHAFSAAMSDFRRAGAQVIGMSGDDLAQLQRFSTQECSSAFPVARASRDVQKAYDVANAKYPGWTTRTSYVIDRSGRIVMVHDDMDFSQHVARTLAAVRSMR